MFVLDSDTVSHLNYEHPRVMANVEASTLRGEIFGITVITKIEILQGRMAAVIKAESHQQFLDAQQRLLETENWLGNMRVFLLDEGALQVFDSLKASRGLKKIGRADLLIASIARAQHATLVTRNQKHFRLIPQLKIENWMD